MKDDELSVQEEYEMLQTYLFYYHSRTKCSTEEKQFLKKLTAPIKMIGSATPPEKEILSANERADLFRQCFTTIASNPENELCVLAHRENLAVWEKVERAIGAENPDFSILPEFYHVSRYPWHILKDGNIVEAEKTGAPSSTDMDHHRNRIYVSLSPEFSENYGIYGFVLGYKHLAHLTKLKQCFLGMGTYFVYQEKIPIQLLQTEEKTNNYFKFTSLFTYKSTIKNPLFDFMIVPDEKAYKNARENLDKLGLKSILIITESELNGEAFDKYNQPNIRPIPDVAILDPKALRFKAKKS